MVNRFAGMIHSSGEGAALFRVAAFVSCVMLVFMASGCSTAKFDPCSLLDVSEAQLFDDTISSSRAFPPKGAEKNDLCLYYNAEGEPRLMVFVWSDSKIDPLETTKSGKGGGESDAVEITGVGEKAAAGFDSGFLKLLAARNKTGMIGVRVRDPVKQDDERFEDLKTLVSKLLGRLE